MNNYIQHIIPHHSWDKIWHWGLTADQQLYIEHKQQEMRLEQERINASIDIANVYANIIEDKR
jgi:hypothetical protein